jgi:pantetheine-phosphate adenylyltransferase
MGGDPAARGATAHGTVALYPGTFDPVTNGHLDLVGRAAALFDRVVVSVSIEGRKTHFSAEERVAFLRPLEERLPNVLVEAFDGLVVEQARRHGARVLLRGIRGARDYEAEMEMAFANAALAPGIETVFLAPSRGTATLSASLVREVAALGGDVSAWVPPAVAAALRSRPPARRGG